MKYFELSFGITPNNEAAADVLAALLADVGCDTFVPNDEGLTAYVQQEQYDEAAIQALVADFPMPDTSITFTCAEAPDENWNATWEAEHQFEPIELPNGESFKIIPRQAFGSGEHATTRMMIAMLASLDLSHQVVVDAGCGTGVLSLAAIKLGAKHVYAYDIDEWSVRNAQDNFELNGYRASPYEGFSPESTYVTDTYPAEITQGDVRRLKACPPVDIVMANINRNILLADLPVFASKLKPDGHLLLSGFYEADVPLLVSKAEELGLKLADQRAEGEWRALNFKHSTFNPLAQRLLRTFRS